MPANYGWFAGRNLLVSQVQTEYFVWCDDDFVFHDQTDLALLLDKIDRYINNLLNLAKTIPKSDFLT